MCDNVFEALFGQAVIENFYNELDSLPPREELAKQYTPSEAHAARMKGLFAREALKDRIHSALIWSKRVAVAALVAVSILFGSLMLVPEVHATVTKTIIEWYDRFVRFTSNAPEAEKKAFEPAYIPVGFWEKVRDEMEMVAIILYVNMDGAIILFESGRASDLLAADSEERTHEITQINGIDYHKFAAIDGETENAIIWDANGQRYSITSTISPDLLLKMAISVEK